MMMMPMIDGGMIKLTSPISYPCKKCNKTITDWNDDAIYCDDCVNDQPLRDCGWA